jgi:hypothetical protein
VNRLVLDSDRKEWRFERIPAEGRLQERPFPPRPSAKSEPAVERSGFVDLLAACGAILIVGLGLAFVFVIALVSLGTLPDEQKAAVVTAAFTVLGTIVGAYFGVKVGSAGKERAESARDAESVKVQELAARVDPETATAALDSAHRRFEAS